MLELGLLHFFRGDDVEGARWLLAAATEGNVKAAVSLGYAHEEGLGVEQDLEEALRWYRVALDLGWAPAREWIAEVEALVDASGRAGGAAGARSLSESAEVERLYEQALQLLYWEYPEGDEAVREAAVLLLAASQRGHVMAKADLAVLLEWSDGELEGSEDASRLAHASLPYVADRAASGDPHAQLLLGSFYELGLAVDENFDVALDWYYLAADQGYAPAQYELGLIWEFVDDVESTYWYREGALRDHPGSAVALGIAYEHGLGVEEDIHQAIHWYRVAAALGVDRVQAWIDELGLGDVDR